MLSIWVGGSNAVATAYCGVSVIAPSWIHPCFLSLCYVHRALLIILCLWVCGHSEPSIFLSFQHFSRCCKCKIFEAFELWAQCPTFMSLKKHHWSVRWIPLVSISRLIMNVQICQLFDGTSEITSPGAVFFFSLCLYKWKLGEINKSAKGRFIYKEEFQRSGSQYCLSLFQEHISFLFHLWHPAQHAHRPLRPCGKHTDGNM